MQPFSVRAENKLSKKIELKSATISTFLIDNNRVHSVVLDMNSVEPLKTAFKFKQYDYGTCFINAQLVDETLPIDLRNKQILGTFRDSKGVLFLDKNNNPLYSYANTLLLDDGVVEMMIPNSVLKGTKNVDCEIIIFDNVLNRMTSPRFSFYIEESMFNHEGMMPSEPNETPICGEAICGEAICGGISTYIEEDITSFLNEDFIKRFGGDINGI